MNPIYMLLDNNLYLLVKRDFKKKARKEKGKRKEGKNDLRLTHDLRVVKMSSPLAVNMRGLILNTLTALAELYNEL